MLRLFIAIWAMCIFTTPHEGIAQSKPTSSVQQLNVQSGGKAATGSSGTWQGSGWDNDAPTETQDTATTTTTSPSKKQPSDISTSTAKSSSSAGPEDTSIHNPEVFGGFGSDIEVGRQGNLNFQIPFEIPKFRGIEPAIGLRFVGAPRKRGPKFISGEAWELFGFPVIERVAFGGGQPRFNQADVYLLDGEQLLGCSGNGATNPATGYANHMLTTNASVSCTTGGNHAQRRNEARRIERVILSGNAEHFLVTEKDGTVLRFDNVGLVGGQNYSTSNIWNYFAVHKKRFLLTSISAPKSADSVTFNYDFVTGSSFHQFGMPERPSSITYGPYTIEFGYLSKPKAAIFGFGIPGIGQQNHLLQGVAVRMNGQLIRGYKIDYDFSTIGNTPRISDVQTYGSDAAFTNGSFVSGSPRDTGHQFTYSDDVPHFVQKDLTGFPVHKVAFSGDIEPDGREELIIPKVTAPFTSTNTAGSVTLKFDWQQNVSSYPTFKVADHTYNPETGVGFQTVGTYSSQMVANGVPGSLRAEFEQGGKIERLWMLHQTLATKANKLINKWGTFAQIDGDSWTELATQRHVYHPSDSGISVNSWYFPSNSKYRQPLYVGDFDGNGITDANDWDGTSYSYHDPSGYRYMYDGTNYDSPIGRKAYTTGDINGDGLDDLVQVDFGASTISRYIHARFSYGRDFSGTYFQGYFAGIPKGKRYFPKTQLVDLNRDGMADLIVNRGSELNTSDGSDGILRFSRGELVFAAMVSHTVPGQLEESYPKFVGTGDFDGNGMPDLISSGGTGKIFFNVAEPAHTLKTIATPIGKSVSIAYAPTSLGYGNAPVVTDAGTTAVPGLRPASVRYVVASIDEDGGNGQTRTVSFKYDAERFDENKRANLGFRTVTKILPAIGSETSGPEIITTYDNSSYETAGNVLSVERKQAGSLQYSVENSWGLTGTGAGPFRNTLDQTENTKWFGTTGIETTNTKTFDFYGNLLSETNLGFTTNGQDNNAADNRTVNFEYAANTTDFIVGLPYSKTVQAGAAPTTNKNLWLSHELFSYDGASIGTAPTVGNLTRTEEWLGNPANLNMRMSSEATYDADGNVLTAKNARGFTTGYTYDTSNNLFVVSETNPLAHVTTTVWDEGCQKPTSSTDANGHITAMAYDAHCREVSTTLPNGFVKNTAYLNFGSPTTQYVRKWEASAASAQNPSGFSTLFPKTSS